MDALFPYYERELLGLRELSREYAARYPKVAGQLQLDGEACNDPHVERLIQSVALLTARIAKRLDDSYPQFTEALLNQLFPHYLKPFPSCAIVQFPGNQAVLRGTMLESAPVQGVACRFRTVYSVDAVQARMIAAQFQPHLDSHTARRLPPDTSALLSLTIDKQAEADGFLRVYINADPGFCAVLRDALFLRAQCAFVARGDDWQALKEIPIHSVGFADDEALIPYEAKSHSAYRLLAEYFAFPDKFNFFDIDLASLPRGEAVLQLALSGLDADTEAARVLAKLQLSNLATGCTPVINLFPRPGVPIAYTEQSADYSLLADAVHPHAYAVYSLDRVALVRQHGSQNKVTDFRPFYALDHGEPGCYWVLRHDEAMAIASPGYEKQLSLVDGNEVPIVVERTAISTDLTCTNRDLPLSIRSDAVHILSAAQDAPSRFLRRPSRPLPAPTGPQSQWRLISQLALHSQSLFAHGAGHLREMLCLYDLAQSTTSRRQIAGILDAYSAASSAWMKRQGMTSLIHGVAVTLVLDEDAFIGTGLHLFAQVLERYFALYTGVNSFCELHLYSHQTGKLLHRCPPRTGSQNPL